MEIDFHFPAVAWVDFSILTSISTLFLIPETFSHLFFIYFASTLSSSCFLFDLIFLHSYFAVLVIVL